MRNRHISRDQCDTKDEVCDLFNRQSDEIVNLATKVESLAQAVNKQASRLEKLETQTKALKGGAK